MGEVVSLRRVRKRVAKAEAAIVASGNRALHGRSSSQVASDKSQKDRATRVLDGARLDQSGDTNRANERATTS